MSRLLSCLVAALACCALLPAFAQQTPGAGRPMTNEDVVKLCSLDLGDDLVVEAIRRAPKVEFRLDVDALAALREKKVGRDVIRAMFDRVPPPPPAPVAAPPAPVAVPAAPAVAAPAPPTTGKDAWTQACYASYKYHGSLLKGRRYEVAFEAADIDPAAAFKRIQARARRSAEKFTEVDEKAGRLVIQRGAEADDGPMSEITFVARPAAAGGARLEGVYQVQRGIFAHSDIKEMLCDWLINEAPQD